MSADSGCTPPCWEASPCPRCGNDLPPRVDPRTNRRHLWSAHDDVRSYVDPDGWGAHLAECDQCAS